MDIDNEIETYDEIAKSRIIGYIEPVLNTNNVSITVIGYKSKNGRYKALIDKIARRIFTPVGKFTVPKYKFDYDGDNILHNGFIEFSVKKISEEPNCKDNKYSIDFDVEIIPKDFLSILTLNGSHSLKYGCFITQDELNSSINKTELKNCSKQFLLKSGNFLYGLFKYEESSDSIKAINGKETNAYKFDTTIRLNYCTEVNQKTYYLGNKDELPFEWFKTIDCMDDKELSDWFKDKLKSCAESEKLISMEKQLFSFIRKFKETSTNMDEIRLRRIEDKFSVLKFTFDEIKKLMNSNSSLTYTLNETLKTMKDEYRSTWASSLDAEKTELESEIANLKAEKFSIQSELEETQFKLDELKENYRFILSGMKSKIPNVTKDFFNSVEIEPIIFEANGLPFTQLKQEKIGYNFFKLLKENLECEKIPKSFESKMNKESVLFTRKACFIPSISWAYFYAKAIRNSKLYLIHVEHDWLHYKDFMNNGLEAVMNSCYENENVNHALVLDSLNLTQPECGLKPLLDIISGYSIIIPGIGKPLPKNLKIFATILPFKEDNKIGLQLNKENFTQWGGISKIEDKLIISPDFLEINIGEGYFEPKDIFMDYDKASIVYDDNDQKLLSKSKTEFEKTIESLADTEKKKLKTIYEEYNEYFE